MMDNIQLIYSQMKKIFFLFALLCGFAYSAAAQSFDPDVIYLRNGKELRCRIVSINHGESVTVRRQSGAQEVYRLTDVARIELRPRDEMSQIDRRPMSTSSMTGANDDHVALRGYAEVGRVLRENTSRTEFSVSMGAGFNRFAYVGLGAMAQRFDNLVTSNNAFADAAFIPVYGDVRFLIPTGLSVRPFIGLRAGMTIPTLGDKFEGGFYGSAVAGLEYKNFTLGAGFTHQELQYKNGYVVDANGVRTDIKENLHFLDGFTLRAGFTF